MSRRMRNLTAVLFLLALGGGLALSCTAFFSGGGHFRAELGKLRRDISYLPTFLAGAENAVNQDLDRNHGFIELYGGIQRLMGRRVVEDVEPQYTVVKLSDGSLSFENLRSGPVDTAPQAEAVADLRQGLARRDIPFLYVTAPQKVRAEEQLPDGVRDYGNQNADSLMERLEEAGVDTLDLRPKLAEKAAQPGFFFRTDHHWTPAGAFAAYQEVAAAVAERLSTPVSAQHTDPDQYEKILYEDYFLGSQGKRVGTLYAGTDDIELWKPRFSTDFTYSVPLNAIERTGPFEQSLLFPERVAEKDYFGGNPYTLYSGGDYSLARMINHLNPDGPRVLLVRESYSCALAPFLALDCSELITVDLRYFNENLLEYVDWLQPDLVMVLYCASSSRLSELYDFTGEGG